MPAATITATYQVGEWVLYHGSITTLHNTVGVVVDARPTYAGDRYAVDFAGDIHLSNVRPSSISPNYYPDVVLEPAQLEAIDSLRAEGLA